MSRPRELAAGAALAAAGVLGWALVRTYPAFDSYFALVWGRELAHGHLPAYQVGGAPTPHPLWTLVAALCSLLGRAGDRALVLVAVLGLVALVWGAARLGAAAWDLPRGLLGALFVGTSFAFGLYAAGAYVDVPFAALVTWAAALEQERPRRGRAPMVLLALAGLLRPEAWVLAVLYALWLWRGGALRAEHVTLVLAPPLLWGLSDLAITGDPLYSLHRTSTVAENVGQATSALRVPVRLVTELSGTVRAPVLALAVTGAALALVRDRSRRLAAPLALGGAGLLAFVIAGVLAGTAEPRYLTVPAVAVCVFAAHALLGWREVPRRERRLRAPWRGGAAAAILAGFVGLVLTLPGSFERMRDQLRFLRDSHDDLAGLLHTPGIAGCRPLTFPTYRLVPVVRWELDLPDGAARAAIGVPTGAPGVRFFLGPGPRAVQQLGQATGTPPATNIPDPALPMIARRGDIEARGGCLPGG